MTPLGAVELVPTAAIFEPGADTSVPVIGSNDTKLTDGVSLYFELPAAPPIVPPA
jgi:hypothetical protein